MTTLAWSSIVLALTLHCCAAADHTDAQATSGSKPTGELTVDAAAKIPPYPPFNVTVDVAKNATTLTWDQAALESVVRYRIYRKGADAKFVRIAETDGTTFVDKSALRGSSYSVTAVNVYGAESPRAPALPPKKQ